MKAAIPTLCGVLALIFAHGAFSADIASGKTKAASCAGCHGPNGVSTNPSYPSLAGQKEQYLVKSTKDYRDGKRKDAMMEGFVKGMSDADIDNISAYYASLKP